MNDNVGGYTITAETFRESTGTYLKPRFRTVKGYTLAGPDGSYLMIGSHGCVAPTYRAAVVERAHRMAQG